MTRQFHQKYQCSNCGCWTTAETGFSRWLRERGGPGGDLRPEDGFVCCDMDYIVHRYKTDRYGRDVQCIMFVEVKTRGGEPTKSQADTLVLIDQFLNNRRHTPTKSSGKRSLNGTRSRALSLVVGREVTVRAYGGYLLQFEQTGPDDSAWIRWGRNRTEITPDQLAQILRFDIDPETLKSNEDFRSHHKPRELPLLSGSR